MSKIIEIPDVLISEWESIKNDVYKDPDFVNTHGSEPDTVVLLALMATYLAAKMR